MYLIKSLTSTLLIASGVLATYGDSSAYGADSTGSGSGSGDSAPDGAADSAVPSSVGAVSAAASTGTAGQVMVHVVKVGNKNGDLTFEPNNLQAAPGSMVQFHFYPKNHSVVQSTFDQPCQPIKNNMPSAMGLFSGFMPVKPDDAMMPSYTIMVNDTKPIWYYCSQGKHCQSGMVGVINPPAANQSRTLESFTTLAKAASDNLGSGQPATSSAPPDTSNNSSGGDESSYTSGYGTDSDSDSSDSSASAASSWTAATSTASIPEPSGGSAGGIVTDTDSGSTSDSISDSTLDSTLDGNTGSTVTMPLAGTNSSDFSGVAAPSGSAGAQGVEAFDPASAAGIVSPSLSFVSSMCIGGLIGFGFVGMW
ncbi:MAG: hypothetical protein Q9183_003314 [Haloplaca sp. 2 TL-2023]